MISAKQAKDATLKSWEEFIEKEINSSIDKHKTFTDGMRNLPKSIQKDLISKGFSIKTPYENYHYIDWGSVGD